jgi:hypothetical protein
MRVVWYFKIIKGCLFVCLFIYLFVYLFGSDSVVEQSYLDAPMDLWGSN